MKLGRRKYDERLIVSVIVPPLFGHIKAFCVPIIDVVQFLSWLMKIETQCEVRECVVEAHIVGKTTDSKRDFFFKQKIETPQLTPLTLSV